LGYSDWFVCQELLLNAQGGDFNIMRITRQVAILFTAVLAVATSVLGQRPSAAASAVREKVRAYRSAHEADIVHEFADLLAIPNLASDQEDIRRNAEHIAAMLRKRGVEARLLDSGGGPPIVFGSLTTPGAKRTLLIYAHYDGQPVDKAQWADDPWKPVLRDGLLEKGAKEVPIDNLKPPLNPEWRIYARSAGDDKVPIQSVVAALDALQANKIPLSVNLKFFFEGEEEAGSAHLPDSIRRYADLLKGDAWLLCDGPVHQTRKMQVYFGARGEIAFEMTLYGPTRSLHDGHYGNWAPNSAALVAHLLGEMRSSDAHVNIPGFYADVRPLTTAESQAIQQIPSIDKQLREELGLAWSEGGDKSVYLQITQPAMNVRGIDAGHVGDKAQNAIPTEARASVDFRLVPNQTPAKIRELTEAYFHQQGFYIVREDPDRETRLTHARIMKLVWGAGNPPARTAMDSPEAKAVVGAIEATIGEPVIKMPTLGGTVPMYLFLDVLKTPVVGVPLANHDNNQHAANENLRLKNLWDGIEIFAGILSATNW
jgi:acetylornithine deacetylase/succinyl-diaminopimelate desuccinylase-like protein